MNDRSHRRLLASNTSTRKGFLTVERDRALRGLLPSADGPRLSATDSDLAALRDMLILAPASAATAATQDRKSTRLNSSHTVISYAVFCLKKKNNTSTYRRTGLATRSASDYPSIRFS